MHNKTHLYLTYKNTTYIIVNSLYLSYLISANTNRLKKNQIKEKKKKKMKTEGELFSEMVYILYIMRQTARLHAITLYIYIVYTITTAKRAFNFIFVFFCFYLFFLSFSCLFCLFSCCSTLVT